MTGFDEAEHPRETTGRFAEKRNSAPAVSLGTDEAIIDPFAIDYPTRRTEVFSSAQTFAEVDATWKARQADVAGDYSDELDLRWAAVNRGRELRRTGAQGVATDLRTEGRDANVFAHAQNDVELVDLYDLATEELHGDGEAPRGFATMWRNRHHEQAAARRAELLSAGAVTGPDPLA